MFEKLRILYWWYITLPRWYTKGKRISQLGVHCHCDYPTGRVDTGDIYQWQCIGTVGKHCGFCKYEKKDL
jgi:hypothetical protein